MLEMQPGPQRGATATRKRHLGTSDLGGTSSEIRNGIRNSVRNSVLYAFPQFRTFFSPPSFARGQYYYYDRVYMITQTKNNVNAWQSANETECNRKTQTYYLGRTRARAAAPPTKTTPRNETLDAAPAIDKRIKTDTQEARERCFTEGRARPRREELPQKVDEKARHVEGLNKTKPWIARTPSENGVARMAVNDARVKRNERVAVSASQRRARQPSDARTFRTTTTPHCEGKEPPTRHTTPFERERRMEGEKTKRPKRTPQSEPRAGPPVDMKLSWSYKVPMTVSGAWQLGSLNGKDMLQRHFAYHNSTCSDLSPDDHPSPQISFSIHFQNNASSDCTLFDTFIYPSEVRTNQRYSAPLGFATGRTRIMPTTAWMHNDSESCPKKQYSMLHTRLGGF
jgi:hypothetical protein